MRFRPQLESLDLVLTALAPISHHDAAEQSDSNSILFNRQKQLLPLSIAPTTPTQSEIDATTAAHPVPTGLAPFFADGRVSFAEFVAVALIRSWLDVYNSADGVGLFVDAVRYERLETRLRNAAVQAWSLRGLWDYLCRGLQVPIHPADVDRDLIRLWSLPQSVQQLALRACVEQFRGIVTLARAWHSETKAQSEAYAKRADVERAAQGSEVIQFDASRLTAGSDVAHVVEVPVMSGNSLRHTLVREPAWLHLCAALGIEARAPGRGDVPVGVEALFVNGGNIKAGAKQPENPYPLAHRMRERYPVLDLLGGVVDSFDLGESRLRVNAWLVCRENRAALAGTPAEGLAGANVSAFDMLDGVTLTRQATRHGVGQMIYSFEVLCPGAEWFVRLGLSSFTPRTTAGALWSAVETARANRETIGGQSARGFGAMAMRYLAHTEEWQRWGEQYEEMLETEREALRDGLTRGTMDTGVSLLAA